MSKKINAGDTLTVGDLTDDYLGAFIEVGPIEGIIHRLRLDRIKHDDSILVKLATVERGVKCAYRHVPVKVITPPPVVQPDEPTILGQCIWIKESRELLGVVADPEDMPPIRAVNGDWIGWEEVLSRAGGRQVIVSDPPRWPDETPEVPERIEVGEWPDDDEHLRGWEWIGHLDYRWCWYAEETRRAGWAWTPDAVRRLKPVLGPWTRGERVE
jgi:hypothetical protein